MIEQNDSLTPDQTWSLANDQLTLRLANQFFQLMAIASLLIGVLECIRGTRIFGLVLITGALLIFSLQHLPVPLRLRSRALLLIIFGMYSTIHILSGGQTLGILIAMPMFVMMSGLIDTLKMSLLWAILAIGLILGAGHLQPMLMERPVTPDPQWLQGAMYRIPIVLCVMAVCIAALYRRSILAYSERMLEYDRALEERNQVLRTEEQRLTDFTQLAADWYWETDADHRLIFLSERFEEMSGMASREALGLTPVELYERFHEPTAEAHRQLSLLDSHEPFNHVRIIWKDKAGRLVILDNHGKPIFDDEGCFVGYRGIVHDITQSEILRRELGRQAHHDELTGVANRRALFAHLESHSVCTRRLAVCVLDLDDFKQVNDRGGHAAGDQVLTDIAERIAQHLGTHDFLARLGGDEFCVLLQSDSVADIRALCQRLVSTIRSYRLDWNGSVLQVGVSIGVCLCPVGWSPDLATDMIRQADQACYEAKQISAGLHIVEHSAPPATVIENQ